MKDNTDTLNVLYQIVEEISKLRDEQHITSLTRVLANDTLEIVKRKIEWLEGEQNG